MVTSILRGICGIKDPATSSRPGPGTVRPKGQNMEESRNPSKTGLTMEGPEARQEAKEEEEKGIITGSFEKSYPRKVHSLENA